MNGNLKKILPFAGLFCGSLMFSTLCADTDSDMSSTSSSMSQTKEITPPAGFAAEQGIGFSVYGDFIYWEARQANIGFAASAFPTNPTASVAIGQSYAPSFKYKPGFKAGIDFDLGHDNWDLNIDYTWLNGSSGKNVVSSSTSDLIALYSTSSQAALTKLTSADGEWFFHYNLINMELGRDYYISQYLTLKPYFGLSGAWNNQKEVIHYTSSTYDVTKHYSQHYWGIGFDTGLNTNWFFDENWSIYGNFALMNLWSKYRVNSSETDLNLSNRATTTGLDNQSIQYGFQNVLDLELGIRWGTTFDDDTMGASVLVGWEQQLWINHAQYGHGASNLSLQGLNARLRFDF